MRKIEAVTRKRRIHGMVDMIIETSSSYGYPESDSSLDKDIADMSLLRTGPMFFLNCCE